MKDCSDEEIGQALDELIRHNLLVPESASRQDLVSYTVRSVKDFGA